MQGKWAEQAKAGLGAARRGWSGLSPKARAVVVAVAAVPVLAFAALGAGGEGEASGGAASPVHAATAAGGDAGAGGEGFIRSATYIESQDLERVLGDIADAGPRGLPTAAADPEYTAKAIALMQSLPKDKDGNPDWSKVDMADYARRVQALGPAPGISSAPAAPEDEALDLDEALDRLADGVDQAAPGQDILDALRDSPQGEDASLLMAHAMALASAGDPWGAVANLLIAHEADPDDASPLVNLAALANSQALPAVALALLAEAESLDGTGETAPMGMREQAALLNNRGHALVLLQRHDEAEAPLREALALNPELSEAARNLVHVLAKTGREDEARALLPRAVWRLRGSPAKPVPVRPADGPAAPGAEATPPGGDTDAIARWARQPWLEERHGSARVPLWIALDLSQRGQIAWPEILMPTADAGYAGYYAQASARFLAARAKAQALQDSQAGPMQALVVKRMTLGEVVQQAIHVQASPLWMVEPIDTDMHPMSADKENLILAGGQMTRFDALDMARSEWELEQAADRLNERYGREARCPPGSTTDECCGIHRAAVERNVAELLPFARDYEEQSRVFFREAYGLSTAIATNLPAGGWHDMTRIDIEAQVHLLQGHVQREVAFAFSHAAPAGGACYDRTPEASAEAADIVVDAPACSAASQWASGKWAFSDNFSVEATCGKIKFVAEVNIIGTKKIKWGPVSDVGLDLGMHAEVEFTMEGTVTIFAGPKGGASGKVGGVGADFGVKDGIYAVIDRNGVKDVGMRVVVGGGVASGQGGATHDVDQMDFSFVSAL